MHKLGVSAVKQAFFVALEMFQTAQRNAAKGAYRRHLVIDGGGFGLEGRERFVEIKFVAALGLAGDGRTEVELLL